MDTATIGLIGLGTMGAALALNIAENGHRIAVWNRTIDKTRAFHAEVGALASQVVPTETLEDLVAAIARPRAIILMVPAGPAVDAQIEALRPLLDPDDLIIDAGNANFHDTVRRMDAATGPFLGIGVSGGEEGARHGPSIMGGGPRALWDRVAPVLDAIAADNKGTPCAAWLGNSGAGHFVKTVHNGIEYADMQMIAEVYGIMRDGLGWSTDQIATCFQRWNQGPLDSYLIEITGKVAAAQDAATDGPLLDVILDAAGQKGTGRWTAIEAQHLAAPIPVIEAAVMARNVSAQREARAAGQARFGAGAGSTEIAPEQLEGALIAGKILCYSQGFDMIARAAASFGWAMPLPEIARVWRAGCIIRSAMLDDMAAALEEAPDRSLMMAPGFATMLETHMPALRQTLVTAIGAGHPMPALTAGLGYFDAMRTARGTANMIQGQRDFFGLHGFVRMDTGAVDQHGPWAD